MLSTPILLLAFNRPLLTKKVFSKIREVKPKKLYIAIDGPRNNHKSDIENIKKVKDVCNNIDWDCKVFYLNRDFNLGCKISVSGAIDWFFEQETKGIILEDDCLPNIDFFSYCEELLEVYENNDKIQMITGDNFQDGIVRGNGSYYFSKLTHVWGWATWKRAWDNYDVKMSFWPEFKHSNEFNKIFEIEIAANYFRSIFDSVYNGKIDTWDYQWNACVWYNNGLSVTPNKNLVTNIGFGPDATHTTDINEKKKGSRSSHSILPLKHLDSIIRDTKADEYVFFNSFRGSEMTIWKKIKKKIKSIIKA